MSENQKLILICSRLQVPSLIRAGKCNDTLVIIMYSKLVSIRR